MENIIFKCEYCDREFVTKNALSSHRGKCRKNPNFNEKKLGGIKSLEAKKEWSEKRKGICFEPFIECYCEFCNRTFNRKSAKTLHEKSCSNNPNRVKGHATILSEESKKKISESMKKAHKEGRAGTFPTRKNCEHSYPEKWLIGILEREFGFIENKNYITEFNFHKQFLDFAWPEKKICIEIDGEQHERFQERIEADKRKDENLKNEGWKELRIKWSFICNNTQESIKIIKDFLNKNGAMD